MIVAEISSENAFCVIATEKGDAECNEFGNALSFFTEGVDVNCKDDELNAIFYTRRAASHFSIGEFTRLFVLQLSLVNLNKVQNINSPNLLPNISFNLALRIWWYFKKMSFSYLTVLFILLTCLLDFVLNVLRRN